MNELPGTPTLGFMLGSPERRLGQLATALEQLVAATFGQLVGNPAVYERRDDNVLIEGAGTVPAALALWAAWRPDRAVTHVAEAGDTPPRPVLDGDRDGRDGRGK